MRVFPFADSFSRRLRSIAIVFVSATRGLFPSVAFVDVFGMDPESGLPVSEHIDTRGRKR